MRLAGEYLNALADSQDSPITAEETFSKLKGLCEKYIGTSAAGTFFSYLKNIYEMDKRNGQYGRARDIIGYLVKIHEDPNYYLDRGNIHLHGFNNPKSAIEDFARALALDPKHPSAYTDLGLAYEIMGDYDKAVIAYRRAASSYPLGYWPLYGARRIDAINLTKSGQIIKDWSFLGPFDNTGIPRELEERILKAADTGEATEWFRPYAYNDFGYVNMSNLFPRKDFVTGYARTHIWSPVKRRALLKAGSDDGITIWVNKKRVWDNPSARSAAIDNDIVSSTLEKGWNTVLLRITQTWGSWGFYFRVTDLRGEPIGDLIFDPVMDDARAFQMHRTREREGVMRAAKTVLSRGLALLLIIALAASIALNIAGAIKTKRAREDFISGITHDLRIPLAAIMAHIERLADGSVKDPAGMADYYKTIAGEAARLNRHIMKILEFSRTKKKLYSFKRAAIAPIVKKAIEDYRYESPREALAIRLDVSGQIPELDVDEEVFSQAIINLLSNADKYSTIDKTIEVGIKARGDKVLVSVKDHGIGIKPKDRKRIFEKFYRAGEGRACQRKGLGLGLAFVKSIVDAHRGKIIVESEFGRGSVFTIELPVPAVFSEDTI